GQNQFEAAAQHLETACNALYAGMAPQERPACQPSGRNILKAGGTDDRAAGDAGGQYVLSTRIQHGGGICVSVCSHYLGAGAAPLRSKRRSAGRYPSGAVAADDGMACNTPRRDILYAAAEQRAGGDGADMHGFDAAAADRGPAGNATGTQVLQATTA